MKEYDVVVIGSGVALGVVFNALSEGLKVALVDKGNLGGTCLNVGCVPSKVLISAADRIADIKDASRFGIQAEITGVDFDAIMGRMRSIVEEGRRLLRETIAGEENLDFYNSEARFTGDRVIEVREGEITGRKIFIAAGTRPFIPPIAGLGESSYLTNESVLGLRKRPESLAIVGGGYIAVEYGHFFSALGTKVSIIQRDERIIPFEEPEISDLLAREMGRNADIYTDAEVVRVGKRGGGRVVFLKDRRSGEEREVEAEQVMVATGRTSNADLLDPGKTGVDTGAAGFIAVDDYLLTSRENIWAFGDIIGKQMFTHAGDKAAETAWHNASHEEKIRMDFGVVPHAVFTRPQIASIGLTEEAARKKYDVSVGKARYFDTVKGEAIAEKEGFAKAVVEKGSGRILGFHIIGPEASVLIQEVVNAMAGGGGVESITRAMHIFPALSEVITETLGNLE